MTQNAVYDLVTNVATDVSVQPGTNLSGSSASDGDAVDCLDGEGPVHGHYETATVTGSPTSFTVTCVLQESDDGQGSWTTVPNSSTLVLSASKSSGFIRGQRTKRYVRCRVTPAFTGGSSPAIDVAGSVLYAKKSY